MAARSSQTLSGPTSGVAPILSYLEALPKARPVGPGRWTACCPAHPDRTPSLSWTVAADGKVLLNCRAGCATEDVVAAIGCTMRDLFTPTTIGRKATRPARPTEPGCTLEAYALSKQLDVEFLKGLGLRNDTYRGQPAVRIPYRHRDGTEGPSKLRITLRRGASQPFYWPKDVPLMPYGLWRLDDALKAGFVVVVEGESDCHTLWMAGLPALGIPGAGSWREPWADYLVEIERIYTVVEPDRGGETVMAWLAASSIRDRVHLISVQRRSEVSR